MELQHAAEQSLGICRRLFRFLRESFFKKPISPNRKVDTEVPVVVYGHSELGTVAAPREVPVESGRWNLVYVEEPKKGIKKSVTTKDDPEVVRADIKKTPSMPAKKEVEKKQEAVLVGKLPETVSDINKRAIDYIQKKKQQNQEMTTSH